MSIRIKKQAYDTLFSIICFTAAVYLILCRSLLTTVYNSKSGGVPERPKGADCKSAVTDFEGSNPSPTTIKNTFHYIKIKKHTYLTKQ